VEKCDENSKCAAVNYGYEGIEKVIDMISRKWKLRILYLLSLSINCRYGKLKGKLGNISHKVLSQQLKELEKDGLIIRIEYPEIPPKVEYMLSDMGLGLIPTYEELD
jgi:DNA-binding HxlR family transcriptional regulator